MVEISYKSLEYVFIVAKVCATSSPVFLMFKKSSIPNNNLWWKGFESLKSGFSYVILMHDMTLAVAEALNPDEPKKTCIPS